MYSKLVQVLLLAATVNAAGLTFYTDTACTQELTYVDVGDVESNACQNLIPFTQAFVPSFDNSDTCIGYEFFTGKNCNSNTAEVGAGSACPEAGEFDTDNGKCISLSYADTGYYFNTWLWNPTLDPGK